MKDTVALIELERTRRIPLYGPLNGSELLTVFSPQNTAKKTGHTTTRELADLSTATIDPNNSAYGAAGDGVTDDYLPLLAAWNASIATGLPLDGRGRTYAVTIPAATTFFLQVGDGMTAGNFTIKQLNFYSGGETRPIYGNGKSGFNLHDIKINRNGLASEGAVQIYTFHLTNCYDFAVDNIEVYGNGKGQGILISGCYSFTMREPFVHDMQWQNATDPGTEQITGMKFIDCLDGTLYHPKCQRLTGQIAAGAITPYQADGIDFGNCTRMTAIAPECDHTWEGIDCSGSGLNDGLCIIGGRMTDIHAYGYKFTSANRNHIISDCQAQRCGLSGFTFFANGATTFDNLIFSNCHSLDSGATNVAGSYWNGNTQQGVGWAIANHASDPTVSCRGVRLNGCSAYDVQVTPTMKYAMTVENVPAESCRPQLDLNWYAANYTISEFILTGAYRAPTTSGYLPVVSATYSAPSLADGAGDTVGPVTVKGAAFFDEVYVTINRDLQGMILKGYVVAADQVAHRLQNETGGTVALTASATVNYRVRKKLH